MHILNFPGFTTVTKLDTHGVGVDTGFIMPIFVNLSSSFLSLLLLGNKAVQAMSLLTINYENIKAI
jgi:hypothetical protein